MESYDALLGTLALTMGASWASGINLYAAMLVLGLGGMTGSIDLPPDLALLANPLVVGAAGIMYLVEFVVDKVPGVDSAWDGLQTFVRIPAGALLAAGAVGDVTPVMEIATGVMGGSLAATSHFTKAGTRALINTSPEPVTNWGASLTEDLAVFGGLWVALNHPVLFLILLAVFLVLAIWLLPKIWRLLKAIFRKIGGWLGLVDNNRPAPAGGLQPASAEASVGTADPPGYEPPSAPMRADTNTNTNTNLDAGSAPGGDLAGQLAALQKLHAAGTLTDEEFERGKNRLLNP